MLDINISPCRVRSSGIVNFFVFNSDAAGDRRCLPQRPARPFISRFSHSVPRVRAFSGLHHLSRGIEQGAGHRLAWERTVGQ